VIFAQADGALRVPAIKTSVCRDCVNTSRSRQRSVSPSDQAAFTLGLVAYSSLRLGA
jgi:hypothetical protein